MQNFKPGTAVPLKFSLVNEAGSVLTPTSLRWRVLDADDTELATWVSIGVMPTAPEIEITVPDSTNGLPVGALRGLRTVELEVTSAAGVIALSESYLLQGSTALAFGVNTFQTYAQGVLRSEDFVTSQLDGWATASRDDREKALMQAYARIMLLPITTYADDRSGEQNRLTTDTVVTNSSYLLREASLATLQGLRPVMLEALRNAQLVEASDILVNDPVTALREEGLMSMTVGESSQFFRGNRLNLPVGKKAMAYLQRWVRFGTVLGRA